MRELQHSSTKMVGPQGDLTEMTTNNSDQISVDCGCYGFFFFTKFAFIKAWKPQDFWGIKINSNYGQEGLKKVHELMFHPSMCLKKNSRYGNAYIVTLVQLKSLKWSPLVQ